MRVAAGRCHVPVLLLLLLLALPARGQTPASSLIKGELVSVGIGGIADQNGIYRAGAWVPVQVRLENRSGKVFAGRLAVEQLDLDGDKVLSVGPKFFLQTTDVGDGAGGGGRLLWTYYWPRPDDELNGIKSVLVLDEFGAQVVATVDAGPNKKAALGLGKADDEFNRSSRNVLLLSKTDMGWGAFFNAQGGTERVRFTFLGSPTQLPDDAKGLDGVDVVVWQADAVKVSDIPPDFQLKAILDWVQAGGHLLISVGTQGQEFLKADRRLADAFPLTITGTREISVAALDPLLSGFDRPAAGRVAPLPPAGSVVQATGTLKPGARPISGGKFGPFAEHPLAVTTLYGRGVITVVTLDAGGPELRARFTEKNWIELWNVLAGWQPGQIKTDSEYIAEKAKDPETVSVPRIIRLADKLPSLIDVTDVTTTRILVALLFLALYWLLAGPVGHVILRYYKVVHWSWWVFGGTVVVATALAGAVVFILHISNYDLRHKSFVIGTVNGADASVLGFYGIYAPASGAIQLSAPDAPGLNYLVPLSLPTSEPVKPFADPQSYPLNVDHPAAIAPIFRNTLKKMQARLNGPRPGIDGTAAYAPLPALIAGELVNHTGYDLEDVRVAVQRPVTGDLKIGGGALGSTNLFTLTGVWKNGATLALDTLTPYTPNLPLENILGVIGWEHGSDLYVSRTSSSGVSLSPQQEEIKKQDLPDDLLYALFDLRTPDNLRDREDRSNIHHEIVRSVGRLTDSTKALRAAGALIVARAGSSVGINPNFVPNPLPISVNGKVVPGKGEILFIYALPLSGAPVAGSAAPPLAIEPATRPARRGSAPFVVPGTPTPEAP